jgi:hypothetical protein
MGESLSLLSLVGMAVGLFYAVGAVLLLRALAGDAVMDRMLEGLGAAVDAADRTRRRWWMPGGALLLAAGLSLLLLSRWTPLAFALAGLFQAAWLLRSGRTASLRAFLLFLLAGALVWWLDREGLWRVWIEPAALELLALAGVAAVVSAVLLRHAAWRPAPLPFALGPEAPRLRLAPGYRLAPLRDAETDAPVDPAGLGLDGALAARIAAWDAGYQACFNDDAPGRPRFSDLAAEQAWFTEGCAIAADIQMACDAALFVALSRLDALMGDPPYAPEDAVALAARCGVAEIREAVQRLEILLLEAEQATEDATRDAIEQERRFLALLLAHVAPRYAPAVPPGLAATPEQVRAWLSPRG